MPDPKDNAKLTGDTHPPELENGPAAVDDTELDDTPARGENPGGLRKDREGTGAGRRNDDKA